MQLTAKQKAKIHFLFQTDQGEIDQRTWWLGILPIGVLCGVLTLIWFLIKTYAYATITSASFFYLPTFLAFIYLIIFTFVLLISAVSFYNLSAKRFRKLKMSPVYATFLPLSILIAVIANWLYPMLKDELSPIWLVPTYVLVLCVFLWSAYKLGLHIE